MQTDNKREVGLGNTKTKRSRKMKKISHKTRDTGRHWRTTQGGIAEEDGTKRTRT